MILSKIQKIVQSNFRRQREFNYKLKIKKDSRFISKTTPTATDTHKSGKKT